MHQVQERACTAISYREPREVDNADVNYFLPTTADSCLQEKTVEKDNKPLAILSLESAMKKLSFPSCNKQIGKDPEASSATKSEVATIDRITDQSLVSKHLMKARWSLPGFSLLIPIPQVK